MIGGTGILPSATINGRLAPGNSVGTITVNGDLSFGSNAVYLVELDATADKTVVTGTANLAGTVTAAFAPGASLARQYTILTAADGIADTFGPLNATGVPAGFAASLGYTSTDVTLTLTAQLQQQLLSSGGNRNQQAVAGAIDMGFNSGNTLPPPFLNLFGLSGPALGSALTQLSGEVATGAAGAGFQSMSQFLGLMLDPFLAAQFTDNAQPRAIGFAAERVVDLPKQILAFGPNGEINPTALVDRRWGVWGAAYGATARFNGDPTIGSNRLTATTGGFAAGIDYKVSPDSVIGLAIAGGALNYGLDLGGSGKGDTVQAGIYGTKKLGTSYVAAALAVAHHDLSTDRTVALAGISDHLTADFTAGSVGARIEAGHRIASVPNIGFTPYGALQAQWFRTPGYSERDVTALAGGFALAYDPQTVKETRSEIGARLDRRLVLANDSIVVLRARGAWAHAFNVDRSIRAVFQSLPGAGFTVIGAEPARDAALVSGGAELELANGVRIGGKFDGELAGATSVWGGSGTIRVVW